MTNFDLLPIDAHRVKAEQLNAAESKERPDEQSERVKVKFGYGYAVHNA